MSFLFCGVIVVLSPAMFPSVALGNQQQILRVPCQGWAAMCRRTRSQKLTGFVSARVIYAPCDPINELKPLGKNPTNLHTQRAKELQQKP